MIEEPNTVAVEANVAMDNNGSDVDG